ncbi:MAG: DUF1501 domain-containing protein [Planctomycetota bacterium]
MIFLCMPGGPAQLDTFDYKPQGGKTPRSGSAVSFARHGDSGLWVSELLPETAQHADKLCVLNGMYCDTGNHAQSFLQMHTGERFRPRPSVGSWVAYGLGTENRDLPGFISLNGHETSVSSSAFLPSVFAGTTIGVNGEDFSTASLADVDSRHLPRSVRRSQLDFIQAMNHEHKRSRPADDARLESVIESMELGFRMQSTARDLLDVQSEPNEVLQRYRVGKKISVGNCRPTDFGRQCLLARRFAEAGVRFIEISHPGWDQHTDHARDLKANCETIDAPIAALLEDLDQRGLLDDTLLVWGGEFGRPGLKPTDKKNAGTGHNPKGFTFWLAGGGVKGGYTHGATNETGTVAVDGRVHFRDLHATILHLLGLRHDRLTFHHEGRDHRLTGPEGGRAVKEIIA